MKRIAIFCDGTWNRHDAPHPTNVVRLAQAVKLTDDSNGLERKQQVFYLLGVGSGRGSNKMARTMDRIAGGALGWGLMDNVIDAYRNLIFCYEPGDEIFIFGFSRGAYTARSLAGLIRSCGIPPRDHIGQIGEAVARYKARGEKSHPDDPSNFLFRSQYAPFTATSEKELNWRIAKGTGICVQVKLAYLGVWDTVGALGVPGFLSLSKFLNTRYHFHDTSLSSSVSAARHAVAIDERRKTFPPSLWSNLERLNKKGLGLESDVDLTKISRDDWHYRQEWFPGDHGSIGGGGDLAGLSSYTFSWIAEGAQKAGLAMRQDILDQLKREANIREAVVNKTKIDMATKLLMMMSSDRSGPKDILDVSDATKERVACDSTYRPKTLSRVMGDIQRYLDDSDLMPPGK